MSQGRFPIRTLRLLALLGALCAPLFAGDFLADSELEKPIQEFAARARQVREGRSKPEQLLAYYAQRAARKGPPRQMAIDAFLYGHALRSFGRPREARLEFERALRIFAAFPAPHVALSGLAEKAGDRAAARRHLKQALAIDPRHQPSIIQLGRIALRENKLEEAEKRFKSSTDIEVIPQACMGLESVYLRMWKQAYEPREKEEWAKKAIGVANVYCFKFPKSGAAHLLRARVYSELGRGDRAIELLEEAYAKAELEEQQRFRILVSLLDLYQRRQEIPKVKLTLQRLLKNKTLGSEDAASLRGRLKDLDEKGQAAFIYWKVDALTEVVNNDGLSVDARRRALRNLIDVFLNDQVLADPALLPLVRRIRDTIFRTLVRAPSGVLVETIRFLRNAIKDPTLIRIMVHFVYPFDDARRTPAVRKEAVRTLAEAGGEAALPTLLYCLSDDRGDVAREVDKGLSRLFQRRSPVGDSIRPLTPDEVVKVRRYWRRCARTKEGAELLAAAFRKLQEVTGKGARDRAYTQTTAPLVDHTVNIALLDNDMPWPAWRAAYDFLRAYWGKDFRPVERRSKPVEEAERPAIVAKLADFWKGLHPVRREPKVSGEN